MASTINLQGKRVLVTGADGFIGSHLTERLVSLGANVTALSLYNSFDARGWLDDAPAAVLKRLQIVRGDIRDATFVRRLVADQEIVLHLAALIAIPYSYSSAQSYVDTNVTGTLNVLEAARATGVERVVHTSTSEVYGTALTVPISEDHPLQGQSPYSASKIGADMIAESFFRSFEIPVAILRPFNTFGPRQSERAIIPTAIRQALDPAADIVEIGDPSPLRDFTFVSDTVAAFVAIATSPHIEFGRPYNAGNNKSISIGEIVETIRQITKCGKPVVQNQARIRPEKSEVRELIADASALRERTGWAPQVSLEEGLRRTVSWWEDRLGRKLVRPEVSYAT